MPDDTLPLRKSIHHHPMKECSKNNLDRKWIDSQRILPQHKPHHSRARNATIPRVIYLTNPNLTQASPAYRRLAPVLRTLAPDYRVELYDDQRCLEFLRHHVGEQAVRQFQSFSVGAHKADLFRYAILYEYGGVYLDMESTPLVPLDDMLQWQRNGTLYLSTCLGGPGCLYNGFIAAPPRNKILLEARDHALQIDPGTLGPSGNPYLRFVNQLYTLVANALHVDHLKPGLYSGGGDSSMDDVYLFKEMDELGLEQRCVKREPGWPPGRIFLWDELQRRVVFINK